MYETRRSLKVGEFNKIHKCAVIADREFRQLFLIKTHLHGLDINAIVYLWLFTLYLNIKIGKNSF